MPRTVQIRDIDDDVYRVLSLRAAELGLSVPELLRCEATRLASRPTVAQWLEGTRRRPSEVSSQDIVDALDESRGSWSDIRG
jgi:antitoxin FitA